MTTGIEKPKTTLPPAEHQVFTSMPEVLRGVVALADSLRAHMRHESFYEVAEAKKEVGMGGAELAIDAYQVGIDDGARWLLAAMDEVLGQSLVGDTIRDVILEAAVRQGRPEIEVPAEF